LPNKPINRDEASRKKRVPEKMNGVKERVRSLAFVRVSESASGRAILQMPSADNLGNVLIDSTQWNFLSSKGKGEDRRREKRVKNGEVKGTVPSQLARALAEKVWDATIERRRWEEGRKFLVAVLKSWSWWG